jgi:1,4-alpha-glucan branching enzyme
MKRILLWALALLLLGLAGCSSLGFVKRRLPPPSQTTQGVVFRFEAPSATVVQLAGSWPENDWLRGQAQTGSFRIGQMTDEDGDGVWTRTEKLTPGRYQYKFVIDNVQWKEDPNNPNRIDDGFGGFNSLIDVR